jgi:hypothetical protein
VKHEPLIFEKPWLLVCEGAGDKAFFRALINHLGLTDFQVVFPKREADGTGGWTKFGKFLDEIRDIESFKKIRAVLLVADNDEDQTARFAQIQNQLRRAGGYGIPDRPQVVARVEGFPSLAVLMIPVDGSPGNLEHCLLEAAYSKWNLQQHLDQYINNTPANAWPVNKQDKARIQCVIATTCRQNPNTPLSFLWDRPDEYRIPVDHPCFQRLADFLRGFGALLNT